AGRGSRRDGRHRGRADVRVLGRIHAWHPGARAARSRSVVPDQPGGAAAHAAGRHGGGRPHAGSVGALAGGAVGMIVTREHQVRARIAGACRVPREGTRLDRLTREQLAWVDRAALLTAAEARAVWEAAVSGVRVDLRATLPLALLAASGAGDGDGYGFGDGYGDGDGSGHGYGHGHGDGYGYGNGHGNGYGYGYG